MKPINVFPDSSNGKPIKRDRLEEFLKQVKTAIVVEHVSGNDSASVGYTKTLAMACQKLFNELETLREQVNGGQNKPAETNAGNGETKEDKQ